MTGMTWDDVENTMTMPRLKALEEQWKITPPIAVSASWTAQYHGLKLAKPAKKNTTTLQDFAQAIGTM